MSYLPVSKYISSLRLSSSKSNQSFSDQFPEKMAAPDVNENVDQGPLPSDQGDHDEDISFPPGDGPYIENGRLYNAYGRPAVISVKEGTLDLEVPDHIFFTQGGNDEWAYFSARFYLKNPSKKKITYRIVSTEPSLWVRILPSTGIILPKETAEVLVITHRIKKNSDWKLVHHITASYFVVLSTPVLQAAMAEARKLKKMWSFVGSKIFPLDACLKQPIASFTFSGQDKEGKASVFGHSCQLQITGFLVMNWNPRVLRWKVRGMKDQLQKLLNHSADYEAFEFNPDGSLKEDSLIAESFQMLKDVVVQITDHRSWLALRQSRRSLLSAFVLLVIAYTFVTRFLGSTGKGSMLYSMEQKTVLPPSPPPVPVTSNDSDAWTWFNPSTWF